MLIPNRLSTLGHPQRLALFRLLLRRYPDRVPATELAMALNVKTNTLSTYVSALMQAGLITQERSGRSLLYAVDIGATRDTLDYLLRDCCRGRPDACSPLSAPELDDETPATQRKYNVLFVCTGNSARSIFAEAILNNEAGDRFTAYSAGTTPSSGINPFALDVLTQKGHDTTALNSKNLGLFQGADAPIFDFVFTVCDQAANEECPAWVGQPISAHWGMPDPAAVDGTEAEKSVAFQHAYGALFNRIKAFANLPVSALDRMTLQMAVDDIAATKESTSL